MQSFSKDSSGAADQALATAPGFPATNATTETDLQYQEKMLQSFDKDIVDIDF